MPLVNAISFFYLFALSIKNDCGIENEQIVYTLSLPMDPTTSEKIDLVKYRLRRRSHVEKIHMSHLVEISFSYWTVQKHEKFFWDVVKSFASLMNPSQVLSIRVIYGRRLPHEMTSFWRDMYARVVRADSAWLMGIPMKWKLHISSAKSALFLLRHEWLCDLRS